MGEAGMTHKPYPPNWRSIQREIENLLRAADPEYEQRVYLTPIFYLDGITETPEKYPLLAKCPEQFQKRFISYFLKEQGRVPRTPSKTQKLVWMLAGAA